VNLPLLGAAVLAALIGLLLAVALVGLMLPRDHVATRRRYVGADPSAVWGVLTHHPAEPGWRKGLDRVERRPDSGGRPVWREVSRRGDVLDLLTEESVPPSRLVRRIVGEGLPFGGTWTIELAPEGAGTLVTVTEHGHVTNPVFRFVSRFVMGHTATIDAYLEALAGRFGEKAAVD
jgi:hypothetical protein